MHEKELLIVQFLLKSKTAQFYGRYTLPRSDDMLSHWLAGIVAIASATAVSCAPYEKRYASAQEQAQIAALAQTDPQKAADAVLQIPGLETDTSTWAQYGNVTGDFNAKQVPWAPWFVEFHKNPQAGLDPLNAAYTWVPTRFWGFEMKDWMVKDEHGNEANQPYFVNTWLEPSKIKRAVVVFPGSFHDSWNQVNMVNNAYNIAKSKYKVQSGSTVLASLLFLNQKDQKSGSVKDGWVYYKNENWSAGSVTHGPGNFSVSAFVMTDKFIDKLRQDYPNLEKVVVMGHSLGAQASLRYAITKSNKNDDILSYWIGNPGTYTYLTEDRPKSSKGCAHANIYPDAITDSSSLPKFVEDREPDKIAQAFLKRRVHFAQGLDDNGPSSKACDTQAQGVNRLQRSAYYVQHVSNVNGGSYPSSFTIDYIEGVSHQDYPMYAADATLHRVFMD